METSHRMPYGNSYNRSSRGGYSGGGGNRSFGGGRGRGNASASRLTGLFKTRRPGLFVGTVRADQMDALIKKIKQARDSEKGLTFFLWKNTEGAAAFSISADVEREQAPRRPIEDDDEPENEGEDDTESIFGKD